MNARRHALRSNDRKRNTIVANGENAGEGETTNKVGRRGPGKVCGERENCINACFPGSRRVVIM
jgi:hypothetical protein